MHVGRLAPSTTGEAHPGTLLAALLAWLDIRARGGRFVVRLENLDHLRCRPAWSAQMLDDLRWFGLASSVARRFISCVARLAIGPSDNAEQRVFAFVARSRMISGRTPSSIASVMNVALVAYGRRPSSGSTTS